MLIATGADAVPWMRPAMRPDIVGGRASVPSASAAANRYSDAGSSTAIHLPEPSADIGPDWRRRTAMLQKAPTGTRPFASLRGSFVCALSEPERPADGLENRPTPFLEIRR